MAARIGGAISPAVLLYSRKLFPGAPYLFFGALALLACRCTVHLPETRGAVSIESASDLQQLVEKAERRGEPRAARNGSSHGSSQSYTDAEDHFDSDDAPLLGGRGRGR